MQDENRESAGSPPKRWMPQAPAPGQPAAHKQGRSVVAKGMVHLGACDRNRPEVYMEDAEDRRGRYIDQIGHSSDAGRIRRWKTDRFRVAFGPQQRGTRPVQRLDRATPHRSGPAAAAAAARPQSTPDRQTS